MSNSLQPDAAADADLVRQVLAGDHSAFDQLVSRYTSAVRGVAYHYTHNAADADDLVQETFLQAYEKLYQIASPHGSRVG